MKEYLELQKRDVEFKYEPDPKERFIRLFGGSNCKYLTFKSADEIFNKLFLPDISEEGKQFIRKNANKEVLCYIMNPYDKPMIYVLGDNDTIFNTECFI